MVSFLRRNQILLSSFLCLLVSLYILAAAARGHLRADPIGPLLIELMRPLQIGAQATVIWVRTIPQTYATWRGLAADNQKLRERIQELEAERNRYLEANATNSRLRQLLKLRSQLSAETIAAAIIGKSASSWFRSFLLDKGSSDGVRKGMAVISPEGVVGQIVAVTSRSAKVLLVTDASSGVDVMIQRSRARGIVSGTVDGGPILKYAQRNEDIEEGDRLVTSGLGGVFPKGLLVGTVEKVRKRNFGMFQYVGVSLAADLSRIEEVLVVPALTAEPKS